jgi:ketosteroid isomerase-like protein
MRKFFIVSMLTAASFMLASCGETAATNNSAAMPVNNANSSPAKPAADTAAAEADVKKMLSDFEAALNKNDADAVGKFYVDDYSLVDQNGQMQTKASRMEQIKTGKIKWENLKFSDVKVRMHPAGDGAFVTSRANGQVSVDGKNESRSSIVTWVAAKQADGWKFMHAQITDIKGDSATPSDEKPAAANTAPANK